MAWAISKIPTLIYINRTMKDHHKQYFLAILKKYRLGKASKEEINFLEKYYDLFESNEELALSEDESSRLEASIKANIYQSLNINENASKTFGFKWSWLRYAAAASVILMLGITLYLLSNPRQNTKMLVAQDIQPGGNKAILTLSNGQKITLDDAAKGQISNQSGISITKTADGQIVYQVAENSDQQEVEAMNTISTPNGGQYTIILSDGSKVKLNAASSLSFPNSFKSSKRTVRLNGEAYFEVAKQNEQRFEVQSGLQTVEVLGTHFNVDAYEDEKDIKTTLLEGSVKIATTTASLMIRPGEQAIIKRNDPARINKQEVDTDKAVSWINDVFTFEGDDLKSIMREVSRWYNVSTTYEGNIPDKKFYGEISRKSKLSEVFKILELNNVQFEIKGKTVNVSYNDQP